MLAVAREAVRDAVGDGLLLDGTVSCCGDDVSLIMTHEHGADAEAVHSFAWDTFLRTNEVANRLGLYGAGQDLLSDAFSGNPKGHKDRYTGTSGPAGGVTGSLASDTDRTQVGGVRSIPIQPSGLQERCVHTKVTGSSWIAPR